MVSLERTLFTNLLITATYDFQREFHKLRTRNLNAPYDATIGGATAICTPMTTDDGCVKPDPNRGNIVNLESTGSEYRHHIRMSARKRFSIFNASANYQFQRQYGDVVGGSGSAASDSHDLRHDWGNTSSPHHYLNASVNARLPLGMFVTGNMYSNSRRYYTVTTGADDNRDSNVNDRPAGVEPNSLQGPRYLNFDLNVSKAFFIGGTQGATSGTNANVFVNLTNAFNSVHYGTPVRRADVAELRPVHQREQSTRSGGGACGSSSDGGSGGNGFHGYGGRGRTGFRVQLRISVPGQGGLQPCGGHQHRT